MADSFVPVQVDFFDRNPLNNPNLPVDKKKKKPRKLFPKYIIILNNTKIRGNYLIRRVLRRGAEAISREIVPLILIRPFRIQIELKIYGREVFK